MSSPAASTRTASEEQAQAVVAAEPEPTARLRAAIGKLSRRLRPTVAGSQLTPSQISVLFTIVRSGPLGLSELAEIEAMNPTMVSRIVGQLSDAGLIRREADRRTAARRSSRRRPQGRRLRERIHRERTRALARYVDELDAASARRCGGAAGARGARGAAAGEARMTRRSAWTRRARARAWRRRSRRSRSPTTAATSPASRSR